MPTAVNRPGTTSGVIYYRPEAEIVTPSAGGTPVRLDANDPPACTGERSPGLINSWAKWSPRVVTVDGNEHYFPIFSSAAGVDDFLIPPAPPRIR